MDLQQIDLSNLGPLALKMLVSASGALLIFLAFWIVWRSEVVTIATSAPP